MGGKGRGKGRRVVEGGQRKEGGKGERRAGQDTHMSLKTPLNAAHQGSESSIDVTRDSNHFCGEEENGSVRTGPEHPVFS